MIIGIDGNEANVKNRVGSGIYAFELLRQFSKNNSNDLLIYLKEPPVGDLPRQNAHFKYHVFGPKKLWTQFALPIHLTVSGPKIDVFFSTAHYGPRFSKVPFVVTIHDLSYLHFSDLFKKEDLMQLTSWSKYSIEKSAHIIAPSQSTKDDIIKSYHVEPSKVSVTYEGYDKDKFKPQSKVKVESVRSKYKIKGDYIITVGTLQPRKNIERLIEAFAITINKKLETRNLSLVIAGKKGWMYDPILVKARESGIEDKVIFTDFVPDEDLPSLISGATLYVNPSLWEGFGIPVIEAQACGVPVMVSNTSSLPEIVGESAILVDPTNVTSIAEGIKQALDPKVAKDLKEKGFKNIKRFSWLNCAQQTLKVLEKAAKQTHS